MAGQRLERREVLRILALAAAASGFPGFSRWTFACGHGATSVVQIKPPRLHAAVLLGRRIRHDRAPDRDDPPERRHAGRARGGRRRVRRLHGLERSDRAVPLSLRPDLARRARAQAARAALRRAPHELANGVSSSPSPTRTSYRAGDEEGREFFKRVREYTVMGFYTSRIGLEQLDYPGLRIYTELPDCPHPGDPEHRVFRRRRLRDMPWPRRPTT